MSDILLYTQQDSPRLRYMGYFLSRYFGFRLEITLDTATFQAWQGPGINYSPGRISDTEVRIAPCGLLQESGISRQQLSVTHNWTWPVFFADQQTEADLPFDMLSAIFYLITRYEEYLPFEADRLGRFPASQSLAFREKFLHLPLVDLWLAALKEQIQKRFPDCPFQAPSQKILGTYDIDQAWAYLHKGWKRTLGGFARSLFQGNRRDVRLRLEVLSKSRRDPFDVYAYLEKIHASTKIPAAFFFPVGPTGPLDKNHQASNKHYQTLISSLANRYAIGLHPSFQSNADEALLLREKKILQAIVDQPVQDSRQHYLMLRFPKTYRQLENIGIQRDFSMGYPDAVGFRASTARPYTWYDLERERISQLQIVPFQLMDMTLAGYLKLSVAEAEATAGEMLAHTQAVNGQFCYIWHNSSFSDEHGWAGWKKVFEHLLLPYEER